MHAFRRRLGAAIATTGLLAIGLGLTVFVGATPAGAEMQSSPVCNQIKGDPTACEAGQGPYGSVQWDVTGGNLVLHVTALGGGWADIRICAPYGAPTKSADCTNDNSPGLLDSNLYTVQMITPAGTATANGKLYELPCGPGQEFIVTVPTSQIAGDPNDWAMHLSPSGCSGSGTHEAFGQGGTVVTTTTTTTRPEETTTTTVAGETTTNTTTVAGETTTTTTQPSTTTTGNAEVGGATEVLGNQLVQTAGNQANNLTLGNVVATQPQSQVLASADELPRTGSGTGSLLVLAGIALILGGLAVAFGEPEGQLA